MPDPPTDDEHPEANRKGAMLIPPQRAFRRQEAEAMSTLPDSTGTPDGSRSGRSMP
jgi:hypothetical protein